MRAEPVLISRVGRAVHSSHGRFPSVAVIYSPGGSELEGSRDPSQIGTRTRTVIGAGASLPKSLLRSARADAYLGRYEGNSRQQ